MDVSRGIEEAYRGRLPIFIGVARGIVGSSDVARDVVQDSFARALASQDSFRGQSVEAWIWRIVVNRALDVRRRAPAVASLDPEMVDSGFESGDGVLVGAILGLPERRRAIVLLRYVAGLSNKEISVALGVREGTVAAALSQARDVLAEAIGMEARS